MQAVNSHSADTLVEAGQSAVLSWISLYTAFNRLELAKSDRRWNVEEGRRIDHGQLGIDIEGWSASWAGTEVPLTDTEFSILRTLAVMPSKVFSRDAIINRLHGPGFAVTDRTIDSHIRNLRGKFAGVGGTDVIETRAGVGYRLGGCMGA